MSPIELFARVTAAFVLAAALTPVVRRLALRWSFVDRPAARKLHRDPVPLFGGAALYIAVVATLLLVPSAVAPERLAGIVGATTLVAAAGLWDDRRGLSVRWKLLAQLAAAGILVATGLFVDLELPGLADAALTLLWIVGITNAFNLLDNMDGLAAGSAALAALGYLLLAARQGGLAAVLAASLLGATLGYLLHNFHPAKIFMGDAGSLFLGLNLAVLGLELQTGRGQTAPWIAALVPVLVLAVPIFDTTLVTVSRIRRGKNPLTTPGRDHLSHRLLRRGGSVSTAVLRIYGLGAGGAGLAFVVATSGPRLALAAAAAVAIAGLWALVKLDGPLGSPARDVGS